VCVCCRLSSTAADRRLLAFGAARADRVAHEEDAAPSIDQSESSLQHADMRLAAGDHERAAGRQPGKEFRALQIKWVCEEMPIVR